MPFIFLWGWCTQTVAGDRETVFHFRTRFHFGLTEKFPSWHNYLIAHMFSNLSKHRMLESFSALQNSHRWGPFKRKNIITSLSLLRPWGILFHSLSTHVVILVPNHLAPFSLSLLSSWPPPIMSSIFFQLLKRHFPTPTHSLWVK